jgi:hypothetical protein
LDVQEVSLPVTFPFGAEAWRTRVDGAGIHLG